MSEVSVISKSTFLGKEIDVYGTAENPLFKAKDVAEWIEHSNPSKMVEDAELDETDVAKLSVGTLTNSYSALFLTEDGLYEVLMQSRKPIAKQFKKGVKEILKTIRKTGTYTATTLFDEKLKAANWLTSYLNLSEVSKLAIAQSIAAPLGLPLPDYVQSKGVLHSASELLKMNNVQMSALKFNAKLIEAGFLKEATRQGTTKLHKFKVITDKGLSFGENQVSPRNPQETQPKWYDNKFAELLKAI